MSDNFDKQRLESDRQALQSAQVQSDQSLQQTDRTDVTNKQAAEKVKSPETLNNAKPKDAGSQKRPDVTNLDFESNKDITIKEVTIEGRRPDQIDQDIQKQTGRTAYETARKLGIEPNDSKNPNWISQVEDKLKNIGIMRPVEGLKNEKANLLELPRDDKKITRLLTLAKSDQPDSDTARSTLKNMAIWVSDVKSGPFGSRDATINPAVLDKFISNFNLSDQVKAQLDKAISDHIPKDNPVIADNRGIGSRQFLAASDQKERIENFFSITSGTGHIFAGLAAAVGSDTARIKAAGQLGDFIESAAMLGGAAAANRPISKDSTSKGLSSISTGGKQQGESNRVQEQKQEKITGPETSQNTNPKDVRPQSRPNVTNQDSPKEKTSVRPVATNSPPSKIDESPKDVKSSIPPAGTDSKITNPPSNQDDYKGQGPYSASDMRKGYEKSEDKGTLTSHTVPPENHPNLRRKAVDLGDGRTVGFDERGLPDFSHVAVATMRVIPDKDYKPALATDPKKDDKDYRAEMRAATRKLADLVGQGNSYNGTKFTDEQMAAIKGGDKKIPGLTWHHTLGSELQLIPTWIHEKVTHIGSGTMRKGR